MNGAHAATRSARTGMGTSVGQRGTGRVEDVECTALHALAHNVNAKEDGAVERRGGAAKEGPGRR